MKKNAIQTHTTPVREFGYICKQIYNLSENADISFYFYFIINGGLWCVDSSTICLVMVRIRVSLVQFFVKVHNEKVEFSKSA